MGILPCSVVTGVPAIKQILLIKSVVNVITPDLPKKEMLLAGTDVPRVVAVAADIVTVVNPELANASVPTLVTELGMSIDVKLVHNSNALEPILVTESGIVTDDKLVHASNA